MNIRLFLLVAAIAMMTVPCSADERSDFFETQIRPLLVNECSQCHGTKKQRGNLRIDSLSGLLDGGDSGPAIDRGRPDASLLLRAVRRDGDLAMPPDKPLTKHQIEAINKWISDGAYWPESSRALRSRDDDSVKKHWAFQPINRTQVPQHLGAWARTPIDAYILRKLRQKNLRPASSANRRTLIRRVSYALTGLPPTFRQVSEFVASDHPDAYTRMVDRFLESQQYGEHWARHWLDVARYSDTKGYVYAREERFWVHAWTYRDWVIKALNEDMPYDRFLLLQIAADQVDDRRQHDLAAMGYLTLGRRFLGIRDDILDDRIDVVCRGTMGLTVGCARCHDHKYDPIPTTDYYSLYGVFDSCDEQLVPIVDIDSANDPTTKELEKRIRDAESLRRTRCNEASDRIRSRIRDYLLAQTELEKYPNPGFDQIIPASDVHPRIVSRFQKWLASAKRNGNPIFRAWHEYRAISPEQFESSSIVVTNMLATLPPDQLNPVVAKTFRTPPGSFKEVIDRYAKLFSDVEAKWKSKLKSASDEKRPPPSSLDEGDIESIRLFLYRPGSPCVIPDVHIVNTEPLFTSDVVNELWKSQNSVDRFIIDSKSDVPHALTLNDRNVLTEPRVFVRGNPANLGPHVPRRLLSQIEIHSGGIFRRGSGRRELADAITDRQNPLTARVIVNRVWMHLFGQGLVSTPSDFGLRSEIPSHPELLDWLAVYLMDNDWSLKKLTRLILCSAVFQQDSVIRQSANAELALQIDPENRMLWHYRPQRLTFEQFRDSILSTSRELDFACGGKPFDLFKTQSTRRTVFALVDRQYLPSTFRTFDFASPDLHIARRSETTVPQQALFVLNHEIVLNRARRLAADATELKEPEAITQYLFQRTLQRDPTDRELDEAIAMVNTAEFKQHTRPPPTAADWSYGYGSVDELNHRVSDFASAPHFTGESWQGGPKLPDSKLGWVSLTALGGHPGNDRQHACVRRWTAPRDMKIRVQSFLQHEPEAGDGIRAFVFATGQPTIHSIKLHRDSKSLDIESLRVHKGDTLDFVVDIDEVLNNDQFLWRIEIEDLENMNQKHSKWDSKSDFTRTTRNQLLPWEQLAHVLLCTNEFMFVE